MSLIETTAFFAEYRDAFDRLEGDAVADLWQVPGSIADAHGPGGTARVTRYGDDASLRANMAALCAVYRSSGFAATDYAIASHVDLGRHHSFADVHWTLRRADGSTLQAFRTGYLLERGAGRIRVQTCVAYEEDVASMAPTDAPL